MKRIISLFLAFLMFTISIKMGVAFHYCKGKMVESKIIIGYGRATCGMEMNNKPCENPSIPLIKNVPCCQNQLLLTSTSIYQVSDHLVQFIFEFIPTIKDLTFISIGQEVESKNFICYRPPPDLHSVSLSFINIFRI